MPTIPHNCYLHFAKGDTEARSNLLKHIVSGITEPQTQTHPRSYPPWLISSWSCCFCHQDRQTRVASEPADKAFSHLSSFPGQVKRKTEKGRHEELPGTAPCSLTQRTWMWSRWDPATHPRRTLSCSALQTLHLDISVYSFQNTVVLPSWEPKYTDRNPFWRCSASVWKRTGKRRTQPSYWRLEEKLPKS